MQKKKKENILEMDDIWFLLASWQTRNSAPKRLLMLFKDNNIIQFKIFSIST